MSLSSNSRNTLSALGRNKPSIATERSMAVGTSALASADAPDDADSGADPNKEANKEANKETSTGNASDSSPEKPEDQAA